MTDLPLGHPDLDPNGPVYVDGEPETREEKLTTDHPIYGGSDGLTWLGYASGEQVAAAAATSDGWIWVSADGTPIDPPAHGRGPHGVDRIRVAPPRI